MRRAEEEALHLACMDWLVAVAIRKGVHVVDAAARVSRAFSAQEQLGIKPFLIEPDVSFIRRRYQLHMGVDGVVPLTERSCMLTKACC